MLIQKINISNYKTYLELDLDLTVDEERPIILVGGANGGGKTTLFEAICGALYGLKIDNKTHFTELLNQGAIGKVKPEISLQITFVGKVLGQQQKYILKRMYKLNPQDKPVEHVSLNMNGQVFSYGTATSAKERQKSEQEVNKIIKANLPQELSKYFLFDAMQSSELLKKNVFAQTIRDNFENVLGFKKYLQLRSASEKVQQEWAQQRLKAEQEAKEYTELCEKKTELQKKQGSSTAKQETLYNYLSAMEDAYNKAKDGALEADNLRKKIGECDAKIDNLMKTAESYAEELKSFVEGIEMNVFLPKLVSNISQEVSNIIRLKEKLRKESTDVYPIELLKDVTSKIIGYLRDLSLCSETVDVDAVVNHIIAVQKSTNEPDPFEYLDEDEVKELKEIGRKLGRNQFVNLDSRRQDLEIQLSSLDSWTAEKNQLMQALTDGDASLISDYETKRRELKQLQAEEGNVQREIEALDARIHKYDIKVQEEPDVKYDTLVKLRPFFDRVADSLLRKKKAQIETEMKEQLNKLLMAYKDHIHRVELSESMENFNIRLYHKAGNEISLNQLNAASKQIFIQVLLKVLRNLGDYEPPVMIDTVMGVLDNESRDALMEEYFPQLAEQTILLCTTSEIRMDSDYVKLEPFISKTYTLNRNVEEQLTTVSEGYFGKTLNL